MSKYTSFSFLNTGEELEKIQAVLDQKVPGDDNDMVYPWPLLRDILKDPGDPIRCYDWWYQELEELSAEKKLEGIEIFLRGVGDDGCFDMWEARGLNGKVDVQRAQFTLPNWEGEGQKNAQGTKIDVEQLLKSQKELQQQLEKCAQERDEWKRRAQIRSIDFTMQPPHPAYNMIPF